MSRLWQDLRYAVRMLRKGPGLTLAVVLSLGLGFGANTALFSVFDAVMLRPLPVEDPNRLVVLTWQTDGSLPMESHSGYQVKDESTGKKSSGSFSYPLFEQMREQNRVFSHVFAFYPVGRTNVQVEGHSELAAALLVSGSYFEGLGVRASAGRLLTGGDDIVNALPVAVISHAYWRRRFGGDAAVVGKPVFINGQPYTIAGVTPPEFYGTVDWASTPEVFLPVSQLPQLRPAQSGVTADPQSWWFGVMGRLRPGVTREQAQAALRVPFRHAVDELTRNSKQKGELPELVLRPGRQGQAEFRGRNSKPLLYALAVVGLVLLIACANVANLLLARASGRRREVAVRLALGSTRMRLIRQLLTESTLFAVLGGVAGVFIAWWSKELLYAWFPLESVPPGLDIPLDLRVLGYSTAVCLGTALLFGLAPAMQATRVDLVQSLKEAAGSVTGSRSRQRMGKAIVVAQVALSLVVLVAAGLFLRTLTKLESTSAGFEPDNLLVFRLDGVLSGYEGERMASLYDEVRARVERLPGVRAVGTTRHPLISGIMATRRAWFSNYTPKPDERIHVHLHAVGGNFFSALGSPLLLGREFASHDNEKAPRVAIVNETVVRNYFGGASPIGQSLVFSSSGKGDRIEIIGVARDMKYASLRDDVPPTVYVPARQETVRDATFLVRAAGDPGALGAAVRQTVQQIDANLPVFGLQTQSNLIRQSLREERQAASLSASFAVLALIMSAIGLYGLMAHSVARRTNEIGIRMALGANPGGILRMVVGQGMRLVALGLVFGLLGAYWAARLVESRLFGVTPTDPATFAGVMFLLAAIALLASWLPARRAMRVNPTSALRYE